MTRNNLYLNSSNLNYLKNLVEDSSFENVSEYSKEEIKKTSSHEMGRIKTKENYFHIILGNPGKNGCPWCGSEPVFKKLPSKPSCPMGPQEFNRYCFSCENCGANGPIMNFYEMMENDEEFMKNIKDRMTHRFNHTRNWDCDLENT